MPVQCGDPLGTGWGDPGYSFEDELALAQALDTIADGGIDSGTEGTPEDGSPPWA